MLNIDRTVSLAKECSRSNSYLAKKLGRSPSLFIDWRKGKSTPTKSDISMLADLLDTTIEYLTGQTDTKEKPTPVSEGEPKSELDIKFEEVTRNLTDEQKMMIIAQMEVLRRNQ